MVDVLPIGTVLLAPLAVFSLVRVRREYDASGTLAPVTVVAVWVLYGLHGALTGLAASRGTWPLPFPAPARWIAGGILAAGGLAMIAAALIEFRSLQRMSGTRHDRLVTTGVYGWSRNPQNVGWAAVYAGVAVASASGAALALVVVFWILFVVYVPLEERRLERVYRDEWRRYAARSPRYLGRPRGPSTPSSRAA